MKRVVVIRSKSEKDKGEAVEQAFADAGFQVTFADDDERLLPKLYEAVPDLVVVVDDLPKGHDLWSRISHMPDIPIIAISGASSERRAEVLEAGVDEYMNEPIHRLELIAKAHSLLRRYQWSRKGKPQANSDTLEVEIGGRRVRLTNTQFRLFACLLLNAGRLLPYSQIMEEVWGKEAKVSLDTLHFHMRRVRQKLHLGSSGPYRLVQVRNRGYYFAYDS